VHTLLDKIRYSQSWNFVSGIPYAKKGECVRSFIEAITDWKNGGIFEYGQTL